MNRADVFQRKQSIGQDWFTCGARAVFSEITEQYRAPFEPLADGRDAQRE